MHGHAAAKKKHDSRGSQGLAGIMTLLMKRERQTRKVCKFQLDTNYVRYKSEYGRNIGIAFLISALVCIHKHHYIASMTMARDWNLRAFRQK